MHIEVFAKDILFQFGDWHFKLKDTYVAGLALTLALVLIALIFRLLLLPRFKTDIRRAGRFQLFFEYLIERLDKFTTDSLGTLGLSLSPYVLGVGAFILFTTFIELLGLRNPLADLNCTLAFGLCTFILINYFAVRQLGLKGRLKSYLKPIWFMAPFKLVSDLATPISLSCRLFGNMLGGYIVMELVYQALLGIAMKYSVLWVSSIIQVFLSLYFVLFHIAIQFYIFSMLSVNFIKEAVED